MKLIALSIVGLLLLPGLARGAKRQEPVLEKDGQILLRAAGLTRRITLTEQGFETTAIEFNGNQFLAGPSADFRMRVSLASPNQKPRGLKPGEGGTIESASTFHGGTDTLSISEIGAVDEGVRWVNPVSVRGDRAVAVLGEPTLKTVRVDANTTEARITAGPAKEGDLTGLAVTVVYQLDARFPAVRKWLEVSNSGKQWMKLDTMLIDDIVIAGAFRLRTALTPAERGAGSSIMAASDPYSLAGLIAGNEVPSALRLINANGAMGYAEQHFEWVVGPGETFRSEPVFFFAFSGKPEQFGDNVSTPLDRAVEGPFQLYLKQRLGLLAGASPSPAPTWVSWSNFGPDITDAIVREQAGIAARAGFSTLALDDGWQRGRLGTEPDTARFPDLAATAAYVHSLGLRLGLWLSCYRNEDSRDLKDMPDGQSVPKVLRSGGVGMSFASPWREYYARDLADLARRYGVSYFKQDFTNVRFGDVAERHESRTRKESVLRGLRGLLEAQSRVRTLAPEVAMEITHEIYWGTPGVPCDLAALKHAQLYHIPPNDYSGVANNNRRYSRERTYDTPAIHQQLLAGCFNARQRFYAHRGLPLEAIEYYAAASFNANGSLTPAIQDRQIASWLMGAPQVFAGDLASLTGQNITRYRQRFDLLRRLQRDYQIYQHFQFSGAPKPTDDAWHWWGKLNERGEGVVVVIRGKAGEATQELAIPWANAKARYQVTALFAKKPLGEFTGKALRQGAIELSLPAWGQEILELRTATTRP